MAEKRKIQPVKKKRKIEPVKKKKFVSPTELKAKKEETANVALIVIVVLFTATMYLVTPFLYDPAHGIYSAAESDRIWLMEYYIEKYIDNGKSPVPKTSDFSGFDRALLVAVKKGNYPIVSMLLTHGANPEANNGEALLEAATLGYTRIVDLFLSWGADVDSGGGAPLLMATINGRYHVAKILLDNVYQDQNANVHTNDDLALFWAVSLKRKKMVELLMEYGADPLASNERAVNIARADGDDEMLQLLGL